MKVLNGKCIIRVANFTNGNHTHSDTTPVGILMSKCSSLFTIPLAELGPKGEARFNRVTTELRPNVGAKLSDSDRKFLSEFNFENSTLTADEQERVKAELLQHKFTFVWEEYPNIGCTNLLTYEIKMKEGWKPFTHRAYRLDPVRMRASREQLHALLADNIIEPAESSYSSPIILIRKPSGLDETGKVFEVKWRCCLDFRHLNQDIIPDVYNLPDIRDIQD